MIIKGSELSFILKGLYMDMLGLRRLLIFLLVIATIFALVIW
jgi:hypothetical protein